MATLAINTTEYERQSPQGGPLPAGIYTMTVVRVQQKQTNDKQGVYEEVEFDISEPSQYSNRKFWDRFNVINKSQKAQQIGREAISDLAKACGINGMLNDDQELMGRTVQARLFIKNSDNPQYPEPKNECRKYYPVGVNPDEEDRKAKGGAVNTQPVAQKQNNWNSAGQQAPQQQVAPAGQTSSAAPWKRPQ